MFVVFGRGCSNEIRIPGRRYGKCMAGNSNKSCSESRWHSEMWKEKKRMSTTSIRQSNEFVIGQTRPWHGLRSDRQWLVGGTKRSTMNDQKRLMSSKLQKPRRIGCWIVLQNEPIIRVDCSLHAISWYAEIIQIKISFIVDRRISFASNVEFIWNAGRESHRICCYYLDECIKHHGPKLQLRAFSSCITIEQMSDGRDPFS